MNKVIYTLLTIITFSCISINANGLVTFGDRSCGKWITDKEKINKPNASFAVDFNWMTGYMTGLALGTGIDILEGTDAYSLEVWIDNYCHANPLKTISYAGSSLFGELLKQKGLNK